MSWDGTVLRSWFSGEYVPDGVVITFECGHIQLFHLCMTELAERRQWPCDACSAEPRARIQAHRDSIKFEDVVGKLKRLREST